MTYLLAAFLFIWETMRVAGEILTSFSSLSMRGPGAVVELLTHVSVAALAVAAAWSLLNDAPHASSLAVAAVLLSALVTVQSLHWSALPRQTAPGDERFFSAIAVAHSAMWVVYLKWSKRSSR